MVVNDGCGAHCTGSQNPTSEQCHTWGCSSTQVWVFMFIPNLILQTNIPQFSRDVLMFTQKEWLAIDPQHEMFRSDSLVQLGITAL